MRARTMGNIFFGPVWNSSGFSSTTRYWLNENPPGIDSGGTGMLMRYVSAAMGVIEGTGMSMSTPLGWTWWGRSQGLGCGEQPEHQHAARERRRDTMLADQPV